MQAANAHPGIALKYTRRNMKKPANVIAAALQVPKPAAPKKPQGAWGARAAASATKRNSANANKNKNKKSANRFLGKPPRYPTRKISR